MPLVTNDQVSTRISRDDVDTAADQESIGVSRLDRDALPSVREETKASVVGERLTFLHHVRARSEKRSPMKMMKLCMNAVVADGRTRSLDATRNL